MAGSCTTCCAIWRGPPKGPLPPSERPLKRPFVLFAVPAVNGPGSVLAHERQAAFLVIRAGEAGLNQFTAQLQVLPGVRLAQFDEGLLDRGDGHRRVIGDGLDIWATRSSKSASGTTRLTRPMMRASSAVNWRAV